MLILRFLQLADVEIASRQAQVFESLKAGQKAVTELQKIMSVDDVEKLMSDTEEAKTYQKVSGDNNPGFVHTVE